MPYAKPKDADNRAAAQLASCVLWCILFYSYMPVHGICGDYAGPILQQSITCQLVLVNRRLHDNLPKLVHGRRIEDNIVSNVNAVAREIPIRP